MIPLLFTVFRICLEFVSSITAFSFIVKIFLIILDEFRKLSTKTKIPRNDVNEITTTSSKKQNSNYKSFPGIIIAFILCFFIENWLNQDYFDKISGLGKLIARTSYCFVEKCEELPIPPTPVPSGEKPPVPPTPVPSGEKPPVPPAPSPQEGNSWVVDPRAINLLKEGQQAITHQNCRLAKSKFGQILTIWGHGVTDKVNEDTKIQNNLRHQVVQLMLNADACEIKTIER